MRRGLALTAFTAWMLLVPWTACHASSSPYAGANSGDDAAEAESAPEPESAPPECNPCFQLCPCTPGDTFFSPGTCTTYTCLDGAWGGGGCLGPGCDDGGDAESGDDDAEGGGGDADAIEDSSALDGSPGDARQDGGSGEAGDAARVD
jgi:hypothetical protein